MSATSAVLLSLALLIATLVAIRWRGGLLMALPFLVTLNGVPLTIGGSSVRLDQLAACLLLVPLAAGVLAGTRRLRLDATTWWLGAILAMNVAASVLNSPAKAYSLFQCANLASAWIIYVILVNFVDTRSELDALFARCLWAAALASGLGIAAFVLALAGVTLGGAEVSRAAAEGLTSAFGAYGTMVEPNIFGSFCGAFLVLTAMLLEAVRDGSTVRQRALIRTTAALCAVGLVVSFTRSAWIGGITGLLALAVLGRRAFGLQSTRVLTPLAAIVALTVLLLLLPGPAGNFLRFKVVNLLNPDSPTATLRLLIYSLALDQTAAHPIVGWGTYSFAPLAAQGADFARYQGWRNIWIGNYLLLALHDTGIIGLVMWVGMLWSSLARGIRTVRLVDAAMARRILGLTAAVTSLLIPFLATTGFSLGFPWLLLGLLAAHVRLSPERRASE